MKIFQRNVKNSLLVITDPTESDFNMNESTQTKKFMNRPVISPENEEFQSESIEQSEKFMIRPVISPENEEIKNEENIFFKRENDNLRNSILPRTQQQKQKFSIKYFNKRKITNNH